MQSLQVYLDTLRAKPHEQKMAISAGAGLGVAALLFVLWMLSWAFNPPSFADSTASAAAGLEQAQQAKDQLQASLEQATSGYKNAETLLQQIQATDPARNPAAANFVNLSTDAQGNVVIEQVDLQSIQEQSP